MDRCSLDRRTPTYVMCRTCGSRLPFQPGQMRLTPTHAALSCAACGAEARVRRSDAVHDPGSDAETSADAHTETGDGAPTPVAAEATIGLGVEPLEEWMRVPRLLWGRRARVA